MKVYIKKRWVKRLLAKQRTYGIPRSYFASLVGVLDAERCRAKSVYILPLGWCLPFNKVKLVSR